MSFTTITVTGGPFKDADGNIAAGTFTATPTRRMQNGTMIVEPEPVAGILSPQGMMVTQSEGPFTLVATDDTGTFPTGVEYVWVLEIDGAPVDPFTQPLSSASPGGTVDISTLMPH